MKIRNISKEKHGFAWREVYQTYHNGQVYHAPSIPQLIALVLEDTLLTK